MNNFNGIIEEYKNIAVDCFEGESLKATAFFLSHCHTDHMKGLESDSFFNRLKTCSEIKMYCSKVTSDVLIGDAKFKHLKAYMTALQVQEPLTMTIPSSETDNEVDKVLVTLLPAGHCPGSVMFLFEGNCGTVLYTGDFRLTKEDLQKMDVLGNGGRINCLDKLYVDTTFCTLDAINLPTRSQSRVALFEILDPWLTNAATNVVYLSCPAQFGCEYLFVELNKRYGMKVHVTQSKLWKYEAIPEILEAVTVARKTTRLHACGFKGPKTSKERDSPNYGPCLPCERYVKPKRKNILFVRFSTMWFTSHNNSSNGLVHSYSENSYRICYSMHSSCEEILELVQHFKPRSLHPLVIPLGSNLENVHKILKLEPEQLSSIESVQDACFGSLKNEALLSSDKGTAETDLDFSLESQLKSPPKKRLKMGSDKSSSSIAANSPTDGGNSKMEFSTSNNISPFKELSNCNEFDFTPVKLSRSESILSSENGTPKWSFEISPCKELLSSPDFSHSPVLNSEPKNPEIKRNLLSSFSYQTSEKSPKKQTLYSLSSSQESFGSDYSSVGRCSRPSSTEPNKNQDSTIEGNSKSCNSINNDFKNVFPDDQMNLLPQLDTDDNQACRDGIWPALMLSSSSEEVIDLTTDEKINNCDDMTDWDSTPELDV